jgi:membrane protein
MRGARRCWIRTLRGYGCVVVSEKERREANGRRAGRHQDLHRRKPRRFGDLRSGAWRRIARRTFDEFRADGVTNLAAALTYRAVLSLLPALIALIALLGVLGQYPQTYRAVLNVIGRVAPQSTVHAIQGPLHGVVANKGGAGALLGIGLLGATWAASGYVGTFSWATNVVWETPRGRSWYRQWPFNLALTIVGLFLGTFLLVALVLSGHLARAVGAQIGLGPTAVDTWNVVKWPAMALVATVMIGGLFYLAPNIRPPPARFLSPGAVVAVLGWAATTAAFGIFVANFGSFNKTYGTLGAMITFLIWVWLTHIAILVGVELDAEIERERQLAAGLPAEDELQMPLRQAD